MMERLSDEQKRECAHDSSVYRGSFGGQRKRAEDERRMAAQQARVFTMNASQIMTNPELVVEAVATYRALKEFWEDIDSKIKEGRRTE